MGGASARVAERCWVAGLGGHMLKTYGDIDMSSSVCRGPRLKHEWADTHMAEILRLDRRSDRIASVDCAFR
ncbi:MAG: hypothetical protein DHS20C15_15140 [Planctomycetota bacterium]|nr:MAG: hypothetical protein DHS20C15_15140 [Planctomycetota bacterium]